MRFRCISVLLPVFFSLSLMMVAGCGRTTGDRADEGKKAPAADGAEKGHDDHAEHGHDHSGWWCVEHGIPEEECGMCDSKLAAEFREKGDWCEEHNRPDSQCFICNPEKAEKYVALYEAKFGEKPPKPTE
jgi:cobalt-zinc-cadmium efflux system membrane fusion protein